MGSPHQPLRPFPVAPSPWKRIRIALPGATASTHPHSVMQQAMSAAAHRTHLPRVLTDAPTHVRGSASSRATSAASPAEHAAIRCAVRGRAIQPHGIKARDGDLVIGGCCTADWAWQNLRASINSPLPIRVPHSRWQTDVASGGQHLHATIDVVRLLWLSPR